MFEKNTYKILLDINSRQMSMGYFPSHNITLLYDQNKVSFRKKRVNMFIQILNKEVD